MTLPAAVIIGLAAQCAPNVAPATIAAIVQTESHGFELAIGVNGLARQPAPASSVERRASRRPSRLRAIMSARAIRSISASVRSTRGT